MKVAILSDVHGFSLALDRVLDDICARGDIDRVIVAGDLCEGGPDPRGALGRLQQGGVEMIQGNTDRDLATSDRESRSAWWTAEQLGDERLELLGSLPFEIRVTPPHCEPFTHDLLVVHANPVDMDRHMGPDLSESDVQDMIGTARAEVIAFGHIHVAYVRRVGDVMLMDVSAVGNPKDRDLRSRWGLATWDGGRQRWEVELQYLDYPLGETERQIRESGVPNPDKVIRKLVRARYED